MRLEKMNTYKDDRGNVCDIVHNGKILEKLHEKLKINFRGYNSYIRINNLSSIVRLVDINCVDNCIVNIDSNLVVYESLKLILTGKNCRVNIGKNCTIGKSEILLDEPTICCSIDDDCLIGWDVRFRAGDGHTVYDLSTKKPLNIPSDISIGKHVWLSREALILKNSVIPDNCVVGCRAVVNKRFRDKNCVYAGIPASKVKSNINWNVKPTYLYVKDECGNTE